ncbi:MAG: hypothetical protein RIU67_2245 [Actinomycetota bacterium]
MGQLGGSRSRVVVVVQTLSGGEERQPLQVSGSIGVGPPAEVVSDPIHRRRSGDVQHGVSDGDDGTRERSEQEHENGDSDGQAQQRAVEEPPIPTIGREVACIAKRLHVARRSSVQHDVRQLHPSPSEQHGRMRIALDIGVRVVLAVNGDPLAGLDAGADPHEDAESETGRTTQSESAVSQRSMEVHRGDHIGDRHCGERPEDRGHEQPHERTVPPVSGTSVSDRLCQSDESENGQRMSSRAERFEELDDESKARWAKFGRGERIYFIQHVGIEVEEVRFDYCRMRLPFRPELEQPMGVVHGGAIATLLDVVVVPAIGSRYGADVGYSTVDMHVQYLSALVKEDAVAEGWIVKRGRSVVFCEAEIIGATSGKLIARSVLTYNVSPARPMGV